MANHDDAFVVISEKAKGTSEISDAVLALWEAALNSGTPLDNAEDKRNYNCDGIPQENS